LHDADDGVDVHVGDNVSNNDDDDDVVVVDDDDDDDDDVKQMEFRGDDTVATVVVEPISTKRLDVHEIDALVAKSFQASRRNDERATQKREKDDDRKQKAKQRRRGGASRAARARGRGGRGRGVVASV